MIQNSINVNMGKPMILLGTFYCENFVVNYPTLLLVLEIDIALNVNAIIFYDHISLFIIIS